MFAFCAIANVSADNPRLCVYARARHWARAGRVIGDNNNFESHGVVKRGIRHLPSNVCAFERELAQKGQQAVSEATKVNHTALETWPRV